MRGALSTMYIYLTFAFVCVGIYIYNVCDRLSLLLLLCCDCDVYHCGCYSTTIESAIHTLLCVLGSDLICMSCSILCRCVLLRFSHSAVAVGNAVGDSFAHSRIPLRL